MKKLTIYFIFIISELLGQDNPIFDSLSYFERNKIKTVYCEMNSWWYALPFKKWQLSFDKDKKILVCHSFVFDDTTSSVAKLFKSEPITFKTFKLKDTIIWAEIGNYYTDIKHFFDSKGRLTKKLIIVNDLNEPMKPNAEQSPISVLAEDPHKDIHMYPNTLEQRITSALYFYTDTLSKKIRKKVIESAQFFEETNFYYEKYLLSMKTVLDSNKIDNTVKFETIRYEYYSDKRLRQEIRRVASGNCPGIVEGTSCEGVINYSYDVE